MSTQICPYCGETIAASAKKCRYCGEWLEEMAEQPAQQPVQYAEPTVVCEDINGPAPVPTVIPTATPVQVPAQPQMPVINQQMPGQAAAVSQPTIVINNQMSQETNVNVGTSSSKSSSGWLYLEMLAVAGLAWGLAGAWWVGLITFIVLAILLQIPVIGHIICIILGAGVGLLAGAISAACDAPTWACWLIGIVVGIGVIGCNLDDRTADD